MAPNDLLIRWRQAFDEYDTRKAAAEGAVVRWEWTSSDRYSLLPMFFRRYPGRGRVLSGPGQYGGFRCGLDAQDRVIVHQVYTHTGDVAETFTAYADDAIESVSCDTFEPRLPRSFALYTLADGRAIHYQMFSVNFGPLVEAIPARLKRAALTEPVYCLVLWFREADFYVPPVPTPGFEADWRAALNASGNEAPPSCGCPPERTCSPWMTRRRLRCASCSTS